MHPNTRRIALLIAGGVTAAAMILVVSRSGLIAWTSLILAVALLAKTWFKPSRWDPALGLGLAAAAAIAWAGTQYYVISTWESGEVVELEIDTESGLHTARVWVLDMAPYPVVYYDAPSVVARSLLSGRPLQFTRAGETDARIPEAARVESLSEQRAAQVFEAMRAKYEERVDAADIYYLMLGRSRDRVALVVNLVEE